MKDHVPALSHVSGDIELRLVPSDSMIRPMDPGFEVLCYKNKAIVRAGGIAGEELISQLLMCKEDSERERLLIHMLQQKAYVRTIGIKVPGGYLNVEWDGTEVLTSLMEFDYVEKRINVRCVALRQNGALINDLLYISRRLVVDVARKKLMLLSEASQWDWARWAINDIQDNMGWASSFNGPDFYALLFWEPNFFYRVSDVLRFTPKQLNYECPFRFLPQYREFVPSLCVFKVNGTVVNPVPSVVHHVIEAHVDMKSLLVRLTPRMMNKELDEALLHPFVEGVCAMNRFDSWLQTKTRRAFIIKTLFNMIGSNNAKDAEKISKAANKHIRDSYASRCTGIGSLKKLFDESAKGMHSKSLTFMATPQGFYEVELNYKSAMRSFLCISALFEEVAPVVSREKGVYWELSAKMFYQRFDAFVQQTVEQGITLLIDGKRVETVSLDVACNVVKKNNPGGGSDWFDLAPHILADGMVLSQEQREVLFNDGGQIEYADCIKILDEKSRNIMQILAKIFNFDGTKSASSMRERTIVEVPRLRILDLFELRQAGAQVRLAEEDEQVIERLTNFSKLKKVALPQKMSGVLREYQKDGYQWLAFLYSHHFGACLADDMGLGKTIQAIAFLGGIAEGLIERKGTIASGMPHLVVMPPTLIFNWQSELQKFYPALRIVEYVGQSFDKRLSCDVVLITYDRLRLNIDTLKHVQFHVIILDEAQAIKNIHASRTAAVRQLNGLFTLALTGTPLENHIGEYYSILDVALPGLLPPYKQFMGYVRQEQHEPFIKKTRPFVLRRTKAAILKDLPDKVEANVMLTMEAKQQKIYATTTLEVKRAIEQAYEQHTAAQANIKALTALLRLRQICISPKMIDAAYDILSPKLEYLLSAVQEIVQEGHAVLVFSQFTTCLDLVEKVLLDNALAFSRIDGSVSMGRRKKIVEDFQSGAGAAVLLLSLKTGGVGLNLTRANYVFHVDIWWNPAVENQASDRAHRMGQKDTVFVNRLVMHHTIEEKILTLQQKKQKLFEEVLEHAENKGRASITKKDFEFLLG